MEKFIPPCEVTTSVQAATPTSTTNGSQAGSDPIPFKPRTKAWFEELIRRRMGYATPTSWQVDLSQAKYEGNDVVGILPTGSGKSTLIEAPLLAAIELNEPSIGITIVPTKALASNHISTAAVSVSQEETDLFP